MIKVLLMSVTSGLFLARAIETSSSLMYGMVIVGILLTIDTSINRK